MMRSPSYWVLVTLPLSRKKKAPWRPYLLGQRCKIISSTKLFSKDFAKLHLEDHPRTWLGSPLFISAICSRPFGRGPIQPNLKSLGDLLLITMDDPYQTWQSNWIPSSMKLRLRGRENWWKMEGYRSPCLITTEPKSDDPSSVDCLTLRSPNEGRIHSPP